MTDEEKRYIDNLKQVLERAKNYSALSVIENLEKENEELKKEISALLSCANCQENKGGYVCEREYNDKYLAQKIEYIKELKEEIVELKKDKERLGKRAEILTNIIMDAFKLNIDLCPLCRAKGEYLPDCECLTDEACLKKLIGLYGE